VARRLNYHSAGISTATSFSERASAAVDAFLGDGGGGSEEWEPVRSPFLAAAVG